MASDGLWICESAFLYDHYVCLLAIELLKYNKQNAVKANWMFLRQDQFDGVTRFEINCDNSRLSNSYATFFLNKTIRKQINNLWLYDLIWCCTFRLTVIALDQQPPYTCADFKFLKEKQKLCNHICRFLMIAYIISEWVEY